MPNNRGPSLVTARLQLEPLEVDHATEMVAVLGAPEMYRFTGGEPPDLATLTRRFEAQAKGSPTTDEEWHNWILRLLDGDVAIGLVQATVTGPAAEVAWMVGVDWQGQGLAREGAEAMCGWLRGDGVTRLVAHIHPQHAASRRVAEALGLSRTDAVDDDGEEVWRG